MLIFLTAALGMYFVRQQGFSAFQKIGLELQNQQIPVQGMFEGLVILISGILLVTPGFLTDIFGFLGLIPVTRLLLLNLIKSILMKRYENIHSRSKKDVHKTIDGDYIEIKEDDE